MQRFPLDIKNLSLLGLKIWGHMSAKRRFQSINLIFLMFLNGIAELLSLSLIIPFISLLVNKEKLFDYPFINNLVNFFEIKTTNELIPFITFLFQSLLI